MFKNKLIISSLLIALSAPVVAEIDKTIIATVDGRDIIAEELIMTAQQNKIDYEGLNAEQKKMLLNGLINRILVANQARKQKMDKDPEIKVKLGALIDSVLASTLLEQESKNAKVTDQEIQDFYDKNIKTAKQKQYKAKHILVKEEKEAYELAEQLASADSAKFAEVAREKSLDKGSALKGGDLGWFNPETMVPTFANAVKGATEGKVTAPVKSQFGWHLILVEESKDITPPTLEESKKSVKQTITKEKVSDYLGRLKDKANIKIKLAE